MAIENHLQSLLMERHDNPHQNELCACRNGYQLVRCRWDGCFQYPTSCERCFIKNHQHNPLHWALVWNTSRQIWVKHDISELEGNTAVIQIGHVGDSQPCSGSRGPISFNITHTNGVHSTRIQFCGCPGHPEKVDQLIRSDLFPATTEDPKSAFTFAVLRDFRMHNLQSKCGAYDYVTSIRRLTDNTFTMKVPVSILIFAFHVL